MRGYFLLFFVVGFTSSSIAQNGARRSFEFLHVPNNARLSALGGVNTSLADRDVSFFFSNPSLVGDSLAGLASATYQFYVADVGQATFSYAHNFRNMGTVMFGIQHLSYGKIKSYDASGTELGEFKSGETVLVVGKSHQISHFRFGINFKVAFSNIAGYRASSVMLDMGGLFIHPKQDLRVGLSIKNAGFVLTEYSETSRSKLPFDVQLGVTFRPEHMPLRFSFTLYNLTSDRETYYNAQGNDPEPGTLDKMLRRVNFATEILVHRNVNLLVGYNYQVHHELKLADAGGAAGLSFGFSARIKSVEFVFSRSSYVVGNAGYAFTLSKNIDNLMKRR